MSEDVMATQLAVADLSAEPSAVLGVIAGAPLTLVDRLYWQRVRALGEAERRGEPRTRARLDELNAAHALLREAPTAELDAGSHKAVRRTRRRAAMDTGARDALATLYLLPGAAPDDVRIAYETLRDGALAGRSDRDADVHERLARLQVAYRSAMPSGGAVYRST